MKLLNTNISRRGFLVSSCAAALAGCSSTTSNPFFRRRSDNSPLNAAANYAALPNEQFPIPAVSLNDLKPKFRRKRVRYSSGEKPGTVIVDTSEFYLYHIEENNRAMRYGVGLGRAGFEWSGRARIAWKREWPTWTPPAEMIEREPHLKKWSAANGGMPPGLLNPLGSRALYIFQGNVDTLYRVHGTPEHKTIGKAVSSGCVRMVNQDVIHLYERVRPGSEILVV